MSTYCTYVDQSGVCLAPAEHGEIAAVLDRAAAMLHRYDRQRRALEGPCPLPALPLDALDAGARIELSCCFRAFWQLAGHAAERLRTGHVDLGDYHALAARHVARSLGFIEEHGFFYFHAGEIELAHRVLALLVIRCAAAAPAAPVPGARVATPLGPASRLDHLRARWRATLANALG